MSDNLYRHSTINTITGKEISYYQEKALEWSREDFNNRKKKHLGALLLDSSLISATTYDYKIIQCGNYIQLYKYKNKRISHKCEKEKKHLIDNDYLFLNKNSVKCNDLKYIELKNINRSKFQLQRLVKSNETKFKTFITLTFSDNVKDIETANKKFAIWRTKIKTIYKDFCYVCVPEFQKRGAVHYHLMTNLEISKTYHYKNRHGNITKVQLIIPQERFNKQQLESMNKKQRKTCYDVKYWPYGFTSIYSLKDINVVGYLTKYMTKDIDNRLWGKKRYLYSMNLTTPREILLDSENIRDYSKIFTIDKLYDKVYSKTYYNVFEEPIEFIEYKFT